jgi:ACS family hexuronate transporter-like MFS transporter
MAGVFRPLAETDADQVASLLRNSNPASALRHWTPTISMLLVSVISYIDRQTLALLSPTILSETHLTGEQYGFIISGFSIAYMLSNPVWGRILDRVGLHAGMTISVTAWTLASVAHSLASGFASFAVARIALGCGEGATFPGGLRTVTETLKPSERGRGVAIAYSGGSLGAIITPIVVTPIALAWGWRSAFLFTGFIGAAWLVLWRLVSRGIQIKDHVSHAETPVPRWNDPHLWSYISAYALGGLPLGFVLYEAANYLSQARAQSQAFIGMVLWIPPLGWEVGYFFWGWLLDFAIRSGTSVIAAARRMMAVCMVLSLLLIAVPYFPRIWMVMLELFVAMFMVSGFVILAVAYATDVYSTAHSGFIAGVGAGSWGEAVALAMPVFGRLFDRQRFDIAFLIAALFPVAGYFGWLWLSSPRPKRAV